MKNTTLTFRFLKRIGLNFSETEYGQVTIWQVFRRTIIRFRNAFLLKYCQNLVLLSPINARLIRPKIWRIVGCTVGKGVFIGAEVMLDSSNAKLIHLEDDVHIAARSILLCHQRDMESYKKHGSYANLPYLRKKVHLKKGCLVGTQCIVMPGVTIGEGAIVGAFSMVNKNIPAWTIAVGIPAKIIRNLK